MSRAVANITARLDAETARFQREMQRAQRTTNNFNHRARAANDSNIRLSDSFLRAANSAAVLNGPLNGISGRLSFIASGIRSVGAGGLALGVGLGATVITLTRAVQTADQFTRQTAVMDAQLRATNNSVGLTRNELVLMSREIGRATLASVDDINRAQSQLLRFTSLNDRTFVRATRLAQDYATVTGQNVSSAAERLGRILEDTANATSRLRREGIILSNAQNKVIDDMLRVGEVTKAQEAILEALEERIGGTGAAEGRGVAGAYDGLTQSMSEFFLEVGNSSSAGAAIESLFSRMDAGLQRVTKSLNARDPSQMIDIDEVEARMRKTLELIRSLEEKLDSMGSIARSGDGGATEHALKTQYELYNEYWFRMSELQLEQREAREAGEREAERRREQALIEEQEKEQAKREEELKKQEEHSLRLIAQLDRRYVDERGRIELEHRERLQQIAGLYADEEALSRLGFRTLEDMREFYHQNELAAYERQQRNRDAQEQERLEKEQDAANRRIAQIEQTTMSEREILQARYEERLEELREFNDQRLLEDERYAELANALEETHQQQLQQLRAAQVSATLGGYSELFDGLAGLTEAFGGKQSKTYRGLFAASKAFAVADSAVQIWNGIAKAANLPFPKNLGAMATVGTATAGIVSNIKGTQLAGARANGGPISPGLWLVGERGPEVLDMRGGRGQITSNENLRAAMSGMNPSGPVDINFNLSAIKDEDMMDLIMSQRAVLASAVMSVLEDQGVRIAS